MMKFFLLLSLLIVIFGYSTVEVERREGYGSGAGVAGYAGRSMIGYGRGYERGYVPRYAYRRGLRRGAYVDRRYRGYPGYYRGGLYAPGYYRDRRFEVGRGYGGRWRRGERLYR
jgi:hypothetical protein